MRKWIVIGVLAVLAISLFFSRWNLSAELETTRGKLLSTQSTLSACQTELISTQAELVLVQTEMASIQEEVAEARKEIASLNEPFIIRYTHSLPASHYMAVSQQEWADLVEETTAGRIEVQLYPAAQLYNDRDALGAISTGAVEVGAFYIHNIAPVDPSWEAMQSMGIPWTQEMVEGLLGGPIGDRLRENAEEIGLKAICYLPWGLSGVTLGTGGSGDPILTPDDLRKRSIRASNSMMTDFDALYGGHGVYISGVNNHLL